MKKTRTRSDRSNKCGCTFCLFVFMPNLHPCHIFPSSNAGLWKYCPKPDAHALHETGQWCKKAITHSLGRKTVDIFSAFSSYYIYSGFHHCCRPWHQHPFNTLSALWAQLAQGYVSAWRPSVIPPPCLSWQKWDDSLLKSERDSYSWPFLTNSHQSSHLPSLL